MCTPVRMPAVCPSSPTQHYPLSCNTTRCSYKMDVHEEGGISAGHAAATKLDGPSKERSSPPNDSSSSSKSTRPIPYTRAASLMLPKRILLSLLAVLLLFLAVQFAAQTRSFPSIALLSLGNLIRSSTTKAPHPELSSAIFHHLGQYSPYFALEPSYVPLPAGCTVDQVSILQRHGSRYPTSGAAHVIQHTVDKLKRAAFGTGCCAPKLQFLRDWQYALGEEDLVLLGVRE